LPDCDLDEYQSRAPKFSFDNESNENTKIKTSECYRLVHRRMLSQSGERTFISCILPKKAAHLHTIISTSFSDLRMLISTYSITQSLVFDFWVKTTGKSDFTSGNVHQIPNILKIATNDIVDCFFSRGLVLSCLTNHYTNLWQECWHSDYQKDCWAKESDRLDSKFFKNLTPSWQRNNALRTDFSRRQALVEIDVLTAMIMNIALDELKTIYRVQFPVLRQNENDTWYDKQGRIVFTCSKGLPGVGFPRKKNKIESIGWEDIKHMKSGTVERTIIDDTQPGGPVERTITYHAPFDRCDREKDYEEVWKEFERRFK